MSTKINNGWERKRIGEVAIIKPPKSEARERVPPDALVSFVPMEDLGISTKYPEPKQTKRLSEVVGSYTYFADGDVLLAKITPCFENGKVGIAKDLENGVGFGSSEFFVLRPDCIVSNEWLFHFLSREDFRQEGALRMSGAVGHKRVPKEFLESCEIPVPPIPEQQRIVGVLDEAFEGLATAKANAEKNLQNARALFESHLHSVFTEGGNGWIPTKLEDATDLITCGVAKRPEYVAQGIPFLSAKNVKNGEVIWSGYQCVSEATHRALTKNNKPKIGDILYTRVGSYGEAAIIDRDIEFSIFVSLTLIKPKSNLLNAFLKHYLNSSTVKQLAASSITGVGVGNLNVGAVREFPIHLPPVAEQRKIVAALDVLQKETQRLASIYEQKLAALEALKKSLLHQAFSGNL
jgi:type I restriction enzyme S subunit